MIYFFAFVQFIFLFFIFRSLSPYFGLIDLPNSRKNHIGKIPLIGGLIIFFNLLFFILYFKSSYYFSVIFYTSSLLVFLGAIDDSRGLGVAFRLVSQLISSLIIVGSGLIITNIGDYSFLPNTGIGILSIFFTVFCVIGLTNSFNFIDGADRLCSGLFIISLSSLLFYANINGTLYLIEDLNIIYILLTSTIFFLFFNFTKKFKIFLGDSGSMFLGFLISWLLILYTQKYEVIHPVLAIWCVTLPSFDIITVVIRRMLRGKNPFKPDRRHIHHILLDREIGKTIVTLTLLIVAIFLNLTGVIVLIYLGPSFSILAFVLLFILYFYMNIKISRY